MNVRPAGRPASLSLVEEPVEGRASEREIDARDTEAERGVIGGDLLRRSSLDPPQVDEDPFQRFGRAVGEALRRGEMRPVDAAVAQLERASILGAPPGHRSIGMHVERQRASEAGCFIAARAARRELAVHVEIALHHHALTVLRLLLHLVEPRQHFVDGERVRGDGREERKGEEEFSHVRLDGGDGRGLAVELSVARCRNKTVQ